MLRLSRSMHRFFIKEAFIKRIAFSQAFIKFFKIVIKCSLLFVIIFWRIFVKCTLVSISVPRNQCNMHSNCIVRNLPRAIRHMINTWANPRCINTVLPHEDSCSEFSCVSTEQNIHCQLF